MLKSMIGPLLILAALLASVPAGASDYNITHEAHGISSHKPTWVMPGTWANRYDNRNSEAVFQISLKKQIMDSGFYIAYTQKSFWQVYNTEESSPFRETNYNPEIFYRIEPIYGSIFGGLGADIGFEHESNGRSMPESRSWNRAYLTPFYAYDNLLVALKMWYITEDSEKVPADGQSGSNNPDIADYMGYGELSIRYQTLWDQLFHLKLRSNFHTGKGAVGLTWSIPLGFGDAFFMIQGFHGYGDSLIDYNRSITRVGMGIMLTR